MRSGYFLIMRSASFLRLSNWCSFLKDDIVVLVGGAVVSLWTHGVYSITAVERQ